MSDFTFGVRENEHWFASWFAQPILRAFVKVSRSRWRNEVDATQCLEPTPSFTSLIRSFCTHSLSVELTPCSATSRTHSKRKSQSTSRLRISAYTVSNSVSSPPPTLDPPQATSSLPL